MQLQYPYQLVGFIEKEPKIGEPVYGGKNGWYPQIALKRRFKVEDMLEGEMLKTIEDYCRQTNAIEVCVQSMVHPERMPVKVLAVEYTPQLKKFHMGFIELFGSSLMSRYPERDGINYYPHITAEYNGKMVINSNDYVQRTFYLQRVCLLKDINNEDSHAYRYFDLQ